MALVRQGFENGGPRGIRQRFAKVLDPQTPIDVTEHPTLAEIAHRQKEIAAWDALNVGGYRFAKPGTIIGALVSAVLAAVAVMPIPPHWPWDILLVILAVFTAVATVACGLLWFDNPRTGSRPQPLEIVQFSRAENLQWMNERAGEPYRATCACPGCGNVSTHLVRVPTKDEPGWAAATRYCAVCGREWAQS